MNKLFGFLGLCKRSGKIIEGYSKCNEARNKKDIFLFLISKDVSESTKKKFIKHCDNKNIPYIYDFSKEELGDAIGRPEVMIIAILDKNMAEKIISIYKSEEKSMSK